MILFLAVPEETVNESFSVGIRLPLVTVFSNRYMLPSFIPSSKGRMLLGNITYACFLGDLSKEYHIDILMFRYEKIMLRLKCLSLSDKA